MWVPVSSGVVCFRPIIPVHRALFQQLSSGLPCVITCGLQSEMERVNSELSKLRQQVREEKRKAEKASQNLEHEIALNQQAQAVIRNLQQQISGAPMQSSGVSAYSQSLEAAMAAQGSSAPRTSSMLAPGATRPAAVRAERRIVATAAATGGEGGPASAANALGTTAFTSPDTSMTGSGMQ